MKQVFAILLFSTFYFSTFSQIVNATFKASNGRVGLKDANGKVILPAKFDGCFSAFSEGLIGVRIGNKWGFADSTGAIKITCIFDEVDYFNNGVTRVLLGNLWGVINEVGNFILPAKYGHIGCWQVDFRKCIGVTKGSFEVTYKGEDGYVESELINGKYEYIFHANK